MLPPFRYFDNNVFCAIIEGREKEGGGVAEREGIVESDASLFFEMRHRLFGLRGSAYVGEYKRLYRELEPALRGAFEARKNAGGGRFTPRDLGAVAVEFRLPLTALSEFLEGYGLLPAGTWERLRDRGCKAKDVGVEWD